MLLHCILAPLNKIDLLASTIAQGQFDTLPRLPWTTEVRNVTVSMNNMSQKLEILQQNEKAKLSLLNTRLQRDELTGFMKKCCFESDLKQLITDNTEAYILMIKVANLTELSKIQA